jgi:hypothetical protein
MLEGEGPLSRAEISDRLRHKGIHTAGQAIAHLVWLAAAEGAICYGPEQRFVRVKDWLGETKPVEREAALAELAVRYLNAHAPACPADLALWSGIRIGDANRAWKAIANRLVEVETERGTRWALRSIKTQETSGIVRLLPAFDEYLLGWQDREVAVSAEHKGKVNRGGGWVHPVALVDGEVVATWSTKRTPRSMTVAVAPFTRLSPAVRRGLGAEAKDLGAYLGVPVDLQLD